MEQNRTTGSVFQNIVFFSLPYLLSYFLQTLYGMADLFIIGQFEGVASTTAVSIFEQAPFLPGHSPVGLTLQQSKVLEGETGMIHYSFL